MEALRSCFLSLINIRGLKSQTWLVLLAATRQSISAGLHACLGYFFKLIVFVQKMLEAAMVCAYLLLVKAVTGISADTAG